MKKPNSINRNRNKKQVNNNGKEIVNNSALSNFWGIQTNERKLVTKVLPDNTFSGKLQSLPKDAPIALEHDSSIVVEILDDTKLRWVGHLYFPEIVVLQGYNKNISAVMFATWLETLMLEMERVAHYSEKPKIEFIAEDRMNYSLIVECDNVRQAQAMIHKLNIDHIKAFRKAWVHSVDRYGLSKLVKRKPLKAKK